MTVAADPFAITGTRNFGAAGRSGTLAVTPRVAEAATRVLWDALYGSAMRTSLRGAPRCRPALLCVQSGDVAHLDWGPLGDPITIAMRTGGAAVTGAQRIANLGDPLALAELETVLTSEEPHLFVIGGVLEQLGDPRPLLRVLRRLLKCHADSRALIGIVERGGPDGEPAHAHYLRRWSGGEFVNFLQAAGFDLLPTEAPHGDGAVLISEIRCNKESYDQFLNASGLPSASSRLVLIAADAEHRETANIERYVLELGRITDSPPLVLTLGGPFADAISASSLQVEKLTEWKEFWNAPQGALEAVLHVVFLYDEIQLIEYQDYGGAFLRVAQAKRAGLLPPGLTCVAICHGSNFYIERVTREFQPASRNFWHLWEKIAVELADCLLFPSVHARWLYLDQLRLRPLGDILLQRLPYDWRLKADRLPVLTHIDTIVFVGDRQRTNGWNEFCAALQVLFTENMAETLALRRIVVVGAPADGAQLSVPPHVSFEAINPPRDALFDRLKELSPCSLTVIARLLSGYPYPLLQALDANCAVIAIEGGSSSEIVPDTLHNQVFCAPSSLELRQALRRALALSSHELAEKTAVLRQAVRGMQEEANAAWRTLDAAAWQRPARVDWARLDPSPVTVVVPVYNRPFQEIEDLIVGINCQTLPPREVIFVDDASDQDFAAVHGNRIGELLRAPARFIRHARNRGLAAARNSGLEACTTEFIAPHDSDNVAMSDFLYRGTIALMANPGLDAVNVQLNQFHDGEDWTRLGSTLPPYRPLGEGLVESLGGLNWLGDAMGIYRTRVLRQLGGWDDTDHAMWEDRALYLRMLASQRRLMNIPQCEAMYRVRSDSMLRSASEFDARQRLARSLTGLTLFDALCLERIINDRGRPPVEHQAPATPMQLLLAVVYQYFAKRPLLRACGRIARDFVRRTTSRGRNLRGTNRRNRPVRNHGRTP